jgi:iron-sulfur cluster assembly protein
VGVKNGGCAGQEYVLEYAEEAGPLDEVVEDKGVKILIEPKAVLFLIGTEIDYEVTKLASKFVFRNPNQTDACGCGESVTIQPARQGGVGRRSPGRPQHLCAGGHRPPDPLGLRARTLRS